MEIGQALTALRAAGTAQNRKIYARHGVGPAMVGVSYKELGLLVKKIGRDHDLALRLWNSGIHDARILSTKIADPLRLERTELERWAGLLDNYVLTDALSALVARSPHAQSLAERWREDPREWFGACGWTITSLLADPASGLPDSYFEPCLKRIEAKIRQSANRLRHSMNQALITIGIRSETMFRLASAAAKRIGVVEVDHGETSCETPAAIPYMQKVLAHRARKTPKAKRAGGGKGPTPKRPAKGPAKRTMKKAAKKKVTQRAAPRKKAAKKPARKRV